MKTKIYLAHPHAMKEYAKELQQKVEALGFSVLNPFDSTKYHQRLSEGWRIKPTQKLADQIVEKDLGAIQRADITLVILGDCATYGTICEMFFSKSINHLTLVLTLEEFSKSHPWVMHCATETFLTEEELLEGLDKYND
jgi:nucleoside 2-deoxyribosyltransferase